MTFHGVFKAQFGEAVDKSLATDVRGAFAEGCTYGYVQATRRMADLDRFCHSLLPRMIPWFLEWLHRFHRDEPLLVAAFTASKRLSYVDSTFIVNAEHHECESCQPQATP
ncbi:hypothetical protein BDZ97DRAFT_1836482 [Flammula alnicola]|nr:hypothetical protein BDZ97DRAFT_1836482 [Flammula alnicola]